MGERKVLNKYFPPDFDPADLPKGQRAKDNAMKVRMMLPMTVRCSTCGEFMYKGTKFNCKKEDVIGEKYLGLQIFRFYMHCRKCSAEITYVTDPQNLDYKVEHGASRNFEVWKQEQSIEEALKAKREQEDEDKLKRIENKTADAKREMDMIEALDDMLHNKGQHNTITTETAIAALKTRAMEESKASGVGDLTEADEEVLRLMVEGGQFTRRLDDDLDNEEPALTTSRRLAPPVKRRKAAPVCVKRSVVKVSAAQDEDNVKTSNKAADRSFPTTSLSPETLERGEQAAQQQGAPNPQGGGLGLGSYSSSSGSESPGSDQQ